MSYILDTHGLVWIGAGDARFSPRAREAIEAPGAVLVVSAVTAWEYADLHRRGRIPAAAGFAALREMLMFGLEDFPARLWTEAEALPDIHRDPVDRMLIAHALALDMTIISGDEAVRSYPVRTLW